jgi:serine/threonine protein kinase
VKGPTSASSPGKLGRYELLARLATGGMGEIFLSRLEGVAGFEKLYVVKKILPHLAQDPRFRGMLIDEARIASRMSHPNICQVYELEETDGQLYIVMEYLEGVTVLPLLRRASKSQTPLPLGLVTGIISQTCEALHYAHELKDRDGSVLNIVHRDVTPSNVFVTETGVAKVLDFGIAKVKNASAQTQTGTVKGKYAYMAPEQLRGGELDRRVDVFAIAVVLFEMLSLRRLFQRKTDYLTFRAVMEQPIPDLRRYRQDISPEFMAVVARALHRESDQRISTVRELGGAILDASAGTRAWSNGEIGDFLKGNFAEVIRKRSATLMSMTRRDAGPFMDKSRTNAAERGQSGGRTTMPLLTDMTSSDQESDTDDDEFPSVESDVHDGVVAAFRPSSASDFAVQTPPPFSNEFSGTTKVPIGNARADGSKDRAPSPEPVAGAPKRSVILPLVGVALVAIAGTALFLLWQMAKKNNTQPAQKIEIIQSPRVDSPDASVAVAVVDAVESTDAKTKSNPLVVTHDASKKPNNPGDPVPAPKDNNNNDALARKILAANLGAIRACGSEYSVDRNGDWKGAITIVINDSGAVSSTNFDPSRNNNTPFGACVRSAIAGISFSGVQGTAITINLKPKEQ